MTSEEHVMFNFHHGSITGVESSSASWIAGGHEGSCIEVRISVSLSLIIILVIVRIIVVSDYSVSVLSTLYN